MALVVFRSKAAAEIFMFAQSAQRILEILGKDDAPRGVITAADVQPALERLTAAVDAEKSALRDARTSGAGSRVDEPADSGDVSPVSLAQRAFPLIEMLRAASKRGVDVTWGV
jgi:hypothetical protein